MTIFRLHLSFFKDEDLCINMENAQVVKVNYLDFPSLNIRLRTKIPRVKVQGMCAC